MRALCPIHGFCGAVRARFSLHPREASPGRETMTTRVNITGVITRFKGSYSSAVRRVAVPGSKKRRQKPKLPQHQFTLQVSVKARRTHALSSLVRFSRRRRALSYSSRRVIASCIEEGVLTPYLQQIVA